MKVVKSLMRWPFAGKGSSLVLLLVEAVKGVTNEKACPGVERRCGP